MLGFRWQDDNKLHIIHVRSITNTFGMKEFHLKVSIFRITGVIIGLSKRKYFEASIAGNREENSRL